MCEIKPEAKIDETSDLSARCEKDGDHKRFIEAKKFSYDKKLFYNSELLKIVTKLTVKIIVNKEIGNNRTGHKTGTGIIVTVMEIKKGTQVDESYFIIRVLTAKHIVSDEAEAKNCKALFWKDDNTDKPYSLVTLRGITLEDNTIDKDSSVVIFVSYDTRVASKYCNLEELYLLNNGPTKTSPSFKEVAIVSHPHGWNKNISFGSATRMVVEKSTPGDEKPDQARYLYNTATCESSSGAAIVSFDETRRVKKYVILPHVHKGKEENVSCKTLDINPFCAGVHFNNI